MLFISIYTFLVIIDARPVSPLLRSRYLLILFRIQAGWTEIFLAFLVGVLAEVRRRGLEAKIILRLFRVIHIINRVDVGIRV